MARQEINEFLKRFMPNITHPDPRLRVTSHELLYDLKNEFPNVRFTTAQLKDCLEAYLGLIEPVLVYVASHPDERPSMLLYRLQHDDASELLLAYFQRAKKDASYDALLAYIRESDAAERVLKFLTTLEPDEEYLVDCIKRIFSIQQILQRFSKPSA